MKALRGFGGQSRTGSRLAARVVRIGLLMLLLAVLWPPATGFGQTGFTFPVTMTFKDSSAPGWVLGGTATLTSGKSDPAGNGWLRLTNNNNSQAGYAYLQHAHSDRARAGRDV